MASFSISYLQPSVSEPYLTPPCEKDMFPLKLVHSLVSGNNNYVTNNPLLLRILHDGSDDDDPSIINALSAQSRNRIPLMLFIPTQELVKDTYRLASIARAIGMDLRPNPSLSHVIFSWPRPPPSCKSSSSSYSLGSSFASSSSLSSCSWSLSNNCVPLPFPSFTTASLSHLRLFATLSKGHFKLAFLKNNGGTVEKIESLSNNNLHFTSLSLYSKRSGERVESMAGLSRALLGMGWTLFRTNCRREDSQDSLVREVYLYRKLDGSRVCNTRQLNNGNGNSGECSRVRELSLPPLDFRNPPLRILQYILLMTDDAFFLA